jgi:hypothetical protein
MFHHFLSTGVLGLSLIMAGCTHASHTQPSHHKETAKMVQTKEALRDLWVGHIFWIRNVVWDDAIHNPAARDAAEKEVLANAKQIASAIQPFYGDAASEELLTLLAGHYGAVKAYSEGSVAGNSLQQEAALAQLASNADEIAVFLSSANPYLPRETVRGLIAAHGAHHVAQITQFQEKDYADEGKTWEVMRQHVYTIADALTTALVTQFPSKFS